MKTIFYIRYCLARLACQSFIGPIPTGDQLSQNVPIWTDLHQILRIYTYGWA